ncbi:hypothetical protein LF858_05640 [Enterococcus lactis]|uniref:hypothetical protein n=1 Tax=Enterococcus lactis TaxID=357441 RepID=UPI001CF4C5E4|nr:hypothetical protein [Enterococcus lactis]EKZ0430609.1 hypothetical protein [Enterococcus faecium]MCA6755504.1 hypothetical protein [Enterococcus lactis]
MFKFIKSVLGYSIAYGVLLFGFGGLLFVLLSTTKSLFDSLIKSIPNKNSLFFEILKFNYRDFLPSFLISACFSLAVFVVSVMILISFRNKMSVNTFTNLGIGLYNVVTAIFFTLMLVLWLNEKGFMIATTIVSFLALLLPMTKRIWKNQFPENPHEQSKQKQ